MKTPENYLKSLIHFTYREMAVFTSVFSEIHFKKNHYFAKEGEYSIKMGFVTNGVLRAFLGVSPTQLSNIRAKKI